MNLEYVDETYKVITEALLYFQKVREAGEDEKMAAARVKLSDWRNFAAIFYAAHLAYCEENRQDTEFTFDSALSHVQSNPSIIVDVLVLAVKTFPKAKDEDQGEAVA